MTKFAFVQVERELLPVATLCRVIGASFSGFYAWLRAIPATRARAEADRALRERVGGIFEAARGLYDSPRVHAHLRRDGQRHSRRQIARLMREMHLAARRERARRRARPTVVTISRSPQPGGAELPD